MQDNSRFIRAFIGLGGTLEDGFRVWFDANLNSRSYVNTEDGTYEKGALVPSSVKKLNVQARCCICDRITLDIIA